MGSRFQGHIPSWWRRHGVRVAKSGMVTGIAKSGIVSGWLSQAWWQGG